MNAGFDRIGLGRFAGIGERLARGATTASVSFGRILLWLLAALIVSSCVWMLMPLSKGNTAQGELAVPGAASAGPAPAANPAAAAASSEARAPAAAELDRLRTSSQNWRRGGLGSKALVTFTLRNDKDYATRDVEILCRL